MGPDQRKLLSDYSTLLQMFVKGNTVRPGSGGAVNLTEASAVVNDIYRLIS